MKILQLLRENELRAMVLLTLVALVLRAVATIYLYSERGMANWDDDHYYLFVGEQIASGNWSPDWSARTEIIIGPTIPLLIAFFIILFNEPVIPFLIYNVLVTSLMVPVLFLLGKVLFSPKVGWFMALWGVLYVEAFKYSPHLLKESTLFLFLPLTILLLIRGARSTRPYLLLSLSALSYSWLIHTDERFFVYLPLFVILFYISNYSRETRAPALKSLLYIGIVILTMIPWTIHNYKQHDQLVLLTPRTTAITSKFWGENLEKAASHFNDNDVRRMIIDNRRARAEQFGEMYGQTPSEYGKWEAKAKALQHFWQPTYFRLHFIQYGFRTEKWSLRHNAASMLFYGIFLPFYLIGLLFFIKRRYWTVLLIAVIPIIHSLMHAYMVWSLERYRSPVVFIVVMTGVWTVLEIAKWLRMNCLKRKLRSWEGDL